MLFRATDESRGESRSCKREEGEKGAVSVRDDRKASTEDRATIGVVLTSLLDGKKVKAVIGFQ